MVGGLPTVLHEDKIVPRTVSGGPPVHSIRVSDQKLHFSSSHFVLGSDGCENLHGHNYTVEIIIEGKLNKYGMVIDFRDVKKQALEVCEQLDHKVLLPGKSHTVQVHETDDSVDVTVGGKKYVFPVEDCVVLPATATTAELLAEHIYRHLEFPDGYRLKVCVGENVGAFGCYEDSHG
jgi:6-pyruvoyltetrahydropterin/6-carboxytetrahydropterin synthase